jgi:cytochrome b involved in lipid metabolism
VSPEAQRIAITEACPEKIRKVKGYWQWFDGKWWQDCAPNREGYNDPLSDLNAVHEAEKVLTLNQNAKYWLMLYDIVYDMNGDRSELTGHWEDLKTTGHATAAQRVEAFLRTLNLWDDTK